MTLILNAASESIQQPLSFGASWQILGPFQIGTREATWGADPLEYLGGFRALQYDPRAQYRSSLPVNGTAKWAVVNSTKTSDTSSLGKASLSVRYDNVDWEFLKLVYGWAAVQYQAWARGDIVVHGDATQHVILYTSGILEYWLDDAHYFGGDYYSYRRAPPVLHLRPGSHKIDIRLVRDVRAFGGVLEPTIDVVLEAHEVSGTLELAKPGIFISDVVDGSLASSVASMSLRNSGEDDVEVVEIRPSDVGSLPLFKNKESQVILSPSLQMLTSTQSNNTTSTGGPGIVLLAGQTRPIAFNISLPSHETSSVHYTIIYRTGSGGGPLSVLHVSHNLTHKSLYDPHKITYLHPGGMASYAMLRPPAKNATCVEAESDAVAHALDSVADICAWVLFPTGVTAWSGDDWHNWGFADVEAAINSIPTWIENVSWGGPGVDVNRWVVSGHSNGGQGTWYALTHRPDRIIAAAPVSGYASIQKYVPYELWQPMDPRRTAIVSGALNSYRHEMMMENAKGIPVLQQHGEEDDNVPTYHSRLLGQLLFQAGANSDYYELPGKGHYFDGIMVTDQLKEFYRKYTGSNMTTYASPQDYSIVVGDPGDMGPKGALKIIALEDPGQYGRVDVVCDSDPIRCLVKTTNVAGLTLEGKHLEQETIDIDGQALAITAGISTPSGSVSLFKSQEGNWKVELLLHSGPAALYRQGRQLGSMTAILRTQGPFTIRHQGAATVALALQISRNLHQYLFADANIVSGETWDGTDSGNLISLVVGADAPPSIHPDFPVKVGATTVSVRDSRGHRKEFQEAGGLAAAFLRPLPNGRLELVLWGDSVDALAQAARLVPMLTGVGQPDFVIMGESARWRGVEGALALGFFDSAWNVTPSSVV
ncbi:hypothetical protein BCR34DRAFT_596592 [Clohesyomyces aquaticus]|uniref:Peptidase S9 prolyl oligopeptidase catalytic domain-containing protein n=1 Tax=Clohesyomyces aquaticus TaxID=1231657 RepID=A0A1Y2A685_9PLEO|nr:hypothetical protein BCR34DRAFT_596592 [Clohesyomyces aquaticus]